MWAMIVKEFRQLGRDRRTLAMMIAMPVLLLVVLGYAASFDVSSIAVAVAGPQAGSAHDQLRDGSAVVAVVTGGARPVVLIDGTQLFAARAALTALASRSEQPGAQPPGQQGQAARTAQPGQQGKFAAAARSARSANPARSASPAALTPAAQVQVLFNPGLNTSDIMIPGLAGVVLVFIGTIITSLGVVRERQSGTLEQLAVMPLRPWDVFLGKIMPYFAVAAADLAIVLVVGVAIFGVPFRGSVLVFGLGALLFLFVTLGIGVLISSVSQNQGQAIQLAVMTLLPLTYFNEISRGVMLRAEPIGALWQPFLYLALLGAVIVTLASLRFRRYLAPARARRAA